MFLLNFFGFDFDSGVVVVAKIDCPLCHWWDLFFDSKGNEVTTNCTIQFSLKAP